MFLAARSSSRSDDVISVFVNSHSFSVEHSRHSLQDVSRMLYQYLMCVIKGVLRVYKEFSKDASMVGTRVLSRF